MDHIPPDAEEVYDQSTRYSITPDFLKLSSLLDGCLENFSSTFLLLDALDECDDLQLKKLLPTIKQMRSKSTRVFCTCRPHIAHIEGQLDASGSIEIFAHEDDVRNYLTHRMNEEWRLSEGIRQHTMNEILKGVKGMYISTSQVCIILKTRFLLAEFQLHHILKEKDPRNAIDALRSLPTDLSCAYENVLERIERNNNRDVTSRAFSWLFHARRPLRMRELQEALSVRQFDEATVEDYIIRPLDLINCCQSLVAFDETSQIVRFRHYTVYEFLQKNYLGQLLSTVDIARICLTYMTFTTFQQGPCSDYDAMSLRFKTQQFGLYAVHYWSMHTKGDGERDPEVLRLLTKLSSSASNLEGIIQFRHFGQVPQLRLRESWTVWTPTNTTMLHIAAENNLVQLAQLLLQVHSPESLTF